MYDVQLLYQVSHIDSSTGSFECCKPRHRISFRSWAMTPQSQKSKMKADFPTALKDAIQPKLRSVPYSPNLPTDSYQNFRVDRTRRVRFDGSIPNSLALSFRDITPQSGQNPPFLTPRPLYRPLEQTLTIQMENVNTKIACSEMLYNFYSMHFGPRWPPEGAILDQKRSSQKKTFFCTFRPFCSLK